MRRINVCLSGFLALVMGVSSVMAQENAAKTLLDRMAGAFHHSDGIWIRYSARSEEGSSAGTIQLKGEKFVLRSLGGVVTWFDGRTQWTYLEANDEVNISEPAPEELRTISPFAWTGLYRQGYTLRLEPGEKGASVIVMEAKSPDTDLQRILLYVEPAKLFPKEIRMRRKYGKEDIVIEVSRCDMDKNYPDILFVFDKEDYPTAEVIDLR